MGTADTTATNGDEIDLDGGAQAFTYNADGTINYIDITSRSGSVYRQSFTYVLGVLATISGWVKQ